MLHNVDLEIRPSPIKHSLNMNDQLKKPAQLSLRHLSAKKGT